MRRKRGTDLEITLSDEEELQNGELFTTVQVNKNPEKTPELLAHKLNKKQKKARLTRTFQRLQREARWL